MEARALIQADSARLSIAIAGERIVPGKMPLRDLRRLAELAQQGLERTARVLLGEPGAAPGPLPEQVRAATELLLVGIEKGSAVALIELPPPRDEESDEDRVLPLPVRDLGLRAIDIFVAGLHSLETATEATVPPGWDNSVMEIAERVAEASAERAIAITFQLETVGGRRLEAHIEPRTVERFRVRHSVVRRRRFAQGLLVLIDLDKGLLDLKTERRSRIHCQFREDLLDEARRLVGETVLVSGEEEVDLATNRAGRLEVDTLETARQQTLPDEAFWRNPSAPEQAQRQGSRQIGSVADLASPEDFSEEDVGSFLEAMRELRSEQ